MIIGKKHFILAAIIIALGAAVYLNWQFAPSESLVAETVANDSTNEFTDENAQYVAAVNQASSTDASVSAEVPVVKDNTNFFEQARNDRKKARDESLATLQEIMDDTSLDSSEKAQAVNSAAKIAENIDKEASIETLIKAKGYSDCVVIISETQVNVIIPAKDGGITAADAAIIKDIIVGQINIQPSCIKIIEAK